MDFRRLRLTRLSLASSVNDSVRIEAFKTLVQTPTSQKTYRNNKQPRDFRELFGVWNPTRRNSNVSPRDSRSPSAAVNLVAVSKLENYSKKKYRFATVIRRQFFLRVLLTRNRAKRREKKSTPTTFHENNSTFQRTQGTCKARIRRTSVSRSWKHKTSHGRSFPMAAVLTGYFLNGPYFRR